ncbi:Immunoglobulin superfamily member 1 [Labeo rohita]|nr:Immunoglobulin superfamily member 1 [Labeo rohita]
MPTFSLTSTHAVVSCGENIQFSCTTPKPRCNVTVEFQLFTNGSSVSSQKHVSSVTFNLVNVNVSNQGSYSCQYSYQNNTIKSPLSNTVNITVVNLQQPSISHSAPDGQFVVGSQRPVITKGHSFTIICSTESQYPGGSFHLFRGSSITRSESAVNHSSSFSFPEADYSHEGTYSCVYEVSVSSRSFSSSASELLLITITASLLPVIGAAVSAVLLLLSVLIIILLLKRRQKQRNKETHSKCSFTKGELQMPALSLTSTRSVVSHGENIQFRCTTPKPRCNANAEFQLLINGSSVSSQKHVSSVTFNLVNVNVSHQGNYSCHYSYQNNIKSPLTFQLPVIGTAVSAVLLLLSVLIVILLPKQRNRGTHVNCSFTKGKLQMPTLSLTSTHAVVSRGENIQFSCTTPKPRCNVNAEFQLFRNGPSVSPQKHVSSVTFNLVNVNVSHQGNYSCQYSYQNNIKSPLSNTVNIIVVDLQQPSIFHSAPDGQFVVGSQGPVITRGHSFTIICFTESQYPGGSFHLFRGSNITRSESAVSHSASFSFPEADYSHEGNYSCVYEVSVSSRSFRSSASELLLITITVDLQQPSISHSAPDGQFVVGSQRPVITRGHSFTIICSTESQYPGGSFHLLRGSNITRSESAVNHSSSFFFPEADYSHEGTYSCVYEVSVSSRSFRSSASELLLITITASLLPVIGAAVSAVLLLLSVLIIILLLKRRQKQRNKETHSKCSFTKGASHDENEDDDEAIYENVEFGENMDHDDSERDYINVDSDKSEQDYINVDSDQSEQNYIDVDSDQSEQDYIDVDCNYSEENYVNLLPLEMDDAETGLFSAICLLYEGELQMPTFSLTSTHAVVSRGENIQFRCTTPKPRCNVNAEFQLLTNGSSVSSQTHVSSVTFSFVNVNVSHQGSYSCQYSYQNNTIKSPLSNTVIITVGE